MTLKLNCCVSNLIYSNLDGNTNKLFKFITIFGRNLNKNSITLIDNLRDKLIILHTPKYLESYIYICTLMYTTLINSAYFCIHMDTEHTHTWKQGKFSEFCTEKDCLAIKDSKTGEKKLASYSNFLENEA